MNLKGKKMKAKRLLSLSPAQPGIRAGIGAGARGGAGGGRRVYRDWTHQGIHTTPAAF